MKAYLLNLDRRRDRLELSQRQLTHCGIVFHRIAAVDKADAPRIAKEFNFRRPPTFSLTDGELGCFLSHLKAWSEFLETGDEYCLVLEDDVVISRSLRYFLDRFAGFDIEANLIRLETFLKPVCLERKPSVRLGTVALHKLYAFDWGAAAYILSRSFAMELVKCDEVPLRPVDHLLFNPVSPFFNGGRTFQAVPALCIQGDRMPGNNAKAVYYSDLRLERLRRMEATKPRRKSGLAKIRRETMRIVNQIKEPFISLRRGMRRTIIPFSHELQDEKASSSPAILSQPPFLENAPTLRITSPFGRRLKKVRNSFRSEGSALRDH